ncbi:flagellar motor switch phosphatase FliY [Clostridium sp. JN-1]|uniref:flagellar motor switch phosphatase FliY n=1 Tax=Clostridium sp. JN-1 TaxID=2483110 RepID=UPI000F0B9B63|nr:flagellar motor switch phosphatase FliY [Clostridium sp. JN-1]
MSNGFLSQEEIDALLNGGGDTQGDTQPVSSEKENNSEEASKGETQTAESKQDTPEENVKQPLEAQNDDVNQITDMEKDLLGEIGNISMGSASTALSTIINQQVNITTPVVSVTTLNDLKGEFHTPNVALEVKFTSGIVGENLLVMDIADAAVIANLMMGGDGKVPDEIKELSEIELSAVSEAMNQMIGSAATSMATMFMREVNISPPLSKIWNNLTEPLAEGISDDELIVKVSFSLNIGDLVDSYIMQLLPMGTAKKIIAIMMGEEKPIGSDDEAAALEAQKPAEQKLTNPAPQNQVKEQFQYKNEGQNINVSEKPIETPKAPSQPRVEVHQASFKPLENTSYNEPVPKNIDLILDVPLEISVVLGRTKKNVKEILNFGTGSLIELDRLAEEPVEILVNGKKVAYGEVVVVDENFGVRITSIVTGEERIKSLGK